jgi:signal transduction histidine kinase
MVATLLAGSLVAGGSLAAAAESASNVLALYSNTRLLPANVQVDRGLRKAFEDPGTQPVALFDEFLDVPRFGGDAYFDLVVSYLRQKYEAQPPDILVAVGETALAFLLRHRLEVFPRVTVVHVAVTASLLSSVAPLPADVVGVPLATDPRGTIEQALRWHPQASRLVLVNGTALLEDSLWTARLREAAVQFQDRVTIEHLTGLSTPEIHRRLVSLGDDAVVFTPSYFDDGAGRRILPRDAVAAMAAVSTAPIYVPYHSFMGTGVVGGRMATFESMGELGGRTVNELLGGASPSSLRLPEVMPSPFHLDWRQARRWGIAESSIPDDVVVEYKEPTFFEAYRLEATLGAVALLVQSGLIAWLLFERRRRRRAEQVEQDLRTDLAHASRLTVAGELTGSIAHEINQPLGAILSNADAADLLLESGSDRREELRAILSEIRRDDMRASEVIRRLRALLTKHEVEHRPFALDEGVRETEAVLRSEARRRQVTLDFRTTTAPVTIVGDRIQTQQVLINLVLNAMDAIADEPEDRRTVVVSMERTAGGVDLAVRDRGHGIAPEHLPKLFEPFFSTKRQGMGLGLSIARTLVESHGGRIWAENAVDRGAVFHVELPAGASTNVALEAQPS